MGGVTTKGFPYPVGTDPITTGDNVIKSLAETLDTFLSKTEQVWGAGVLPNGGGAGVNQTVWFTTMTGIGAAGGVVVSGDGITVPKKGYYLCIAMGGFGFNQILASTGSLNIGDGAAVWARACVYNNGNDPSWREMRTVTPVSIAQLDPGSKVRWGVSMGGGTSGGVADFPGNNVFAVVLLSTL